MNERIRFAPDADRGTNTGTLPEPPPSLLCVDDESLFLRALTRFLTRAGYRVAAFENPQEALQEVREIAPDVAILDVRMPGMSGLDLAGEIQETLDHPIPIILLSALSADADIIRGYRRGARHYVTKPCEPRYLVEVIEDTLGHTLASSSSL